MKSKKEIQRWFDIHSVMERDAWAIHGYLLGMLGTEIEFSWFCRSRQRQSTYNDFIRWFKSEREVIDE